MIRESDVYLEHSVSSLFIYMTAPSWISEKSDF